MSLIILDCRLLIRGFNFEKCEKVSRLTRIKLTKVSRVVNSVKINRNNNNVIINNVDSPLEKIN